MNKKFKKISKKCFQYDVTVELNHEQIINNPDRISEIKFFRNQYESKETDFPSESKHCRRFEKIIQQSLLVLCLQKDKEEIKQVNILKHNLVCKNCAILLMTSDGRKRHYLPGTKLSELLKGIT